MELDLKHLEGNYQKHLDEEIAKMPEADRESYYRLLYGMAGLLGNTTAHIAIIVLSQLLHDTCEQINQDLFKNDNGGN